MEDPGYASDRGLSIVHFLTPPDKHSNEQWMMLSKAWGVNSRNIVETSTSDLSPFHKEHLEVSGRCPLSSAF